MGPWEKVAQLRRCCEVQIRSSLKDGTLRWNVSLRRLDDEQGEPLVASHDDIDDAVSIAVKEAERRGWLNAPRA